MGVYHLLVQAFPIVLWNTAFLFVLVRVLSDRDLAHQLAGAVPTLILLGLLGGAVTYVLGFLVWPFEALTSSPLGRNHLLLASWTMGYWSVLLVFAWRHGDALWYGTRRWIMLGLSGLGVGLLNITGTLGGSVAHNPSAASDFVRFVLGWEIYTTFYVPNGTLALFILVSVALVALALRQRRRSVSSLGRPSEPRARNGVYGS